MSLTSHCQNPECPLPDGEFFPAYPNQPYCSAVCRREAKPDKRRERSVAKAAFKSGDRLCQAPWCTKRAVHDHHVVKEKHVIRLGGDPNDYRNALGTCFYDHEQHHAPNPTKLPLTCLHERNLQFAFELMGDRAADYLATHYDGYDERIRKYVSREVRRLAGE